MKTKFSKNDYVFISTDTIEVGKDDYMWIVCKITSVKAKYDYRTIHFSYRVKKTSEYKDRYGDRIGDLSKFELGSMYYEEGIKMNILSEEEIDGWILAHTL